jgi:tetratricopeptide (TPR) repeat protein
MGSDLIDLAERLLAEGNVSSADYALQEVPAPDRDQPPYWITAAKVSAAGGAHDRAWFQVQRAESLGAPFALTAPIQATLYRATSRWNEAATVLRRLIDAQPWNRTWRRDLVVTLASSGQVREALALSREALSAEPTDADVFLHASLLVDVMEMVPVLRVGDRGFIATPSEVQEMDALARECLALPLTHQQRQQIGIDPILADMDRARRDLSSVRRRYADGLPGQVMGFGRKVVITDDDDTLSRLAWAGTDAAIQCLPREGWRPMTPWRVAGTVDDAAVMAQWQSPGQNVYSVRSIVQRVGPMPAALWEFRFAGPVNGAAVPSDRETMVRVWDTASEIVRAQGIPCVVDCQGEAHA